MKEFTRQSIDDDMLEEVSGGIAQRYDGTADNEENVLEKIINNLLGNNKEDGEGKHTDNNKFGI